MFFSKRLKTRNNLELMIYLKRAAELWTIYNKFEVWSISDTPALLRFFLVFFLLVVLSVAKDRKYSVFKRVKLFFPDRHFLVKYGICFHRAISPGIWAAKLNCIFTKARNFKKNCSGWSSFNDYFHVDSRYISEDAVNVSTVEEDAPKCCNQVDY